MSNSGLDAAKKDVEVLKIALKQMHPEKLIKAFVPDGPKTFGGYQYYYNFMANIAIQEELASRGATAEAALRANTQNTMRIWEAINGPGLTVGIVCTELLRNIRS